MDSDPFRLLIVPLNRSVCGPYVSFHLERMSVLYIESSPGVGVPVVANAQQDHTNYALSISSQHAATRLDCPLTLPFI